MGSRLILFHANCPDGLFGALTFYLIYDKKADYIPIHANSPVPDVRGKDVCIVDFCYPGHILESLQRNATHLMVIDHHLGSKEALSKIPEKFYLFDPNESAATLAWKHLFPKTPIPKIYNYIRSRDLKLNDLPDIDAFSVALDLNIRKDDLFGTFNDLKSLFNEDTFQILIQIGKTMLVYQHNLVSRFMENLFFQPIRLEQTTVVNDVQESHFVILIVAYLNLGHLIEETAAEIFEKYEFLDLCVFYSIDTESDVTRFVLQSQDDRENVLWIAQKFGGIGNRNSAYFHADSVLSTLPCEHLNKNPLRCVLQNKPLIIPGNQLTNIPESEKILNTEYLELLKRKFPDTTLKLEVSFDSKI